MKRRRAQVLLRTYGAHEGVAYVVEGHTRNVEVEGLQLDPNRMFSRAGAEANLRAAESGCGTEARLRRALDHAGPRPGAA